VDAVVVEPKGCHPSFVQGYYDRDNRFYVDWDAVGRDPDRLSVWLDEWVYGTESHAEYVDKMGVERWSDLTPAEAWSQPVNYGSYR
jgi:glutaconate CoA-transferase subunit A